MYYKQEMNLCSFEPLRFCVLFISPAQCNLASPDIPFSFVFAPASLFLLFSYFSWPSSLYGITYTWAASPPPPPAVLKTWETIGRWFLILSTVMSPSISENENSLCSFGRQTWKCQRIFWVKLKLGLWFCRWWVITSPTCPSDVQIKVLKKYVEYLKC